ATACASDIAAGVAAVDEEDRKRGEVEGGMAKAPESDEDSDGAEDKVKVPERVETQPAKSKTDDEDEKSDDSEKSEVKAPKKVETQPAKSKDDEGEKKPEEIGRAHV